MSAAAPALCWSHHLSAILNLHQPVADLLSHFSSGILRQTNFKNTQFLMHCIMLNTVHCSFEICKHLQHLPMFIGWLVRPSIGDTLRRLNATLTQFLGLNDTFHIFSKQIRQNLRYPSFNLRVSNKFFTFIIYLPRVLNCSPSLFSFSDQLKFWLLPCLPGPWMNFISTSAEIKWSISFTKIFSWINLLEAALCEIWTKLSVHLSYS